MIPSVVQKKIFIEPFEDVSSENETVAVCFEMGTTKVALIQGKNIYLSNSACSDLNKDFNLKKTQQIKP